MNRQEFYYAQLVTEGEINGAFDYCEEADRAMVVDAGAVGIYSGLGVAQASSPNLTVTVGLGAAYDQLGERISLPAQQVVNCAVDYEAVSTTVVTAGNEKWLSVFLTFARSLSDPRTDGNGNPVEFQQAEGFSIQVVQGVEAATGTASKPSLVSPGLLLADVHRAYGVTTIATTDISVARRQAQFNLSTLGPFGTVSAVMAALQAEIEAHIASTTAHPAANVTYAGGVAWLDSTTNPASDVETQLDKLITDLIATTTSHSGADRIGCAAITSTPSSLPAGTVQAGFAALLGAVNDRAC